MSPFISFKDDNNTYCLQVAFPHYLGILQTHKLGVISAQLTGYNLFLNFKGTLGGNRIGNDLAGAAAVMNNMALWFTYNAEVDEKFKM